MDIMRKILFTFLLSSVLNFAYSQQTVGLFENDSLAFNGYTLFSPLSSTNTYLIDNCGRVVNSWESDYRPGELAYLLENGNLLRACRIGSPVFNGGGTGGRLEIYDWGNNLLWSYEYASSTYHSHHDLEYLPNGNILVLAWEYRSASEAIAAGRNPAFLNDEVWPTHVVELEPFGTNDANIVWEWHLWDHLIQDFDSTKTNYGIIADHPELVNLNYFQSGGSPGAGSGDPDWQHCNSVDYNPVLDQIIINSRNFNELWIIDHSTTTAEAAGHTGGNSGKGGDILYRWGNPEAYDRGTSADRKFFAQHDSHWITEGSTGVGNIMIFNNGTGRPGGSYSSIDVIVPPLEADGTYTLTNDAYGPEDLDWTYVADVPASFYSSYISGAQRLSNGNTLICSGANGEFFEVDIDGNTLWRYVNPVTFAGPVSQGSSPFGQNAVFRAYRYAPDYPAFDGIELMPGDLLELDPLPSDCEIYDVLTSVEEPEKQIGINFYPNPAATFIEIDSNNDKLDYIRINSISGKQMSDNISLEYSKRVEISYLQKGMYLIQFYNKNHQLISTKKLVKLVN